MINRIILDEKEIPRVWYNILADLKGPLDPPLHPVTKRPLTDQDMEILFPKAVIEQEKSTDRFIQIPEQVLDTYTMWRPSPLCRAIRLEKVLDTPARIYYKKEDISPPGSHKPNTAVAQAYYNRQEGIKRLTTETGAGQWGSALGFAGKLYGLDITVYMVRVSYEQKPYRRILMQTWGADVYPSPTNRTQVGLNMLEKDMDCPGSIGIAISEAIEDASMHNDVHYAHSSVLNHVLLHQTIIGLEAKKQLSKIDEYPDIVIGCVGGGSNLGGLALPFAQDKINGKEIRLIAVEPSACPTLTKGIYAYDYSDAGKKAPIIKMYTLGHGFMPPSIHAGGLRYHGASPIISKIAQDGLLEAVAYPQTAVFEAALLFTRVEGFIPAPETAHAIKATIDEAVKAREEGKEKVILFCYSGHGHFDLKAYADFLDGQLADQAHSVKAVENMLDELPVAS